MLDACSQMRRDCTRDNSFKTPAKGICVTCTHGSAVKNTLSRAIMVAPANTHYHVQTQQRRLSTEANARLAITTSIQRQPSAVSSVRVLETLNIKITYYLKCQLRKNSVSLKIHTNLWAIIKVAICVFLLSLKKQLHAISALMTFFFLP